ncbi:MAG: 4Fe-4S dicluster domain-containing protein [Candidatus Marinimicrobia bacterium]|nr:4Fe-4S dicluster domain-containing protein [Candidatus Neomarinimicrobiota bacterium]MBL7109602.1 4Fe-4S dicluster domain-containing protein [Candidatus Neomarinimicrobiota bacterium]
MDKKTHTALSRKSFFKEFVQHFSEEMKLDTSQYNEMFQSVTLPPGAKSVEDYIEKCNKCYDCVSVCPHSSIRVRHDENEKLSGFPIIEPRLETCQFCDDRLCVESCKTDALSSSFQDNIVSELNIDKEICHSFNERLCYTCVTNCPKTGEAIAMNKKGNPEINNELCNGCGICIQVCPAEESAIKIKSY